MAVGAGIPDPEVDLDPEADPDQEVVVHQHIPPLEGVLSAIKAIHPIDPDLDLNPDQNPDQSPDQNPDLDQGLELEKFQDLKRLRSKLMTLWQFTQ